MDFVAVAFSLALPLALGASVLLVDGDLRKPTFKGQSGSSGKGLTSLLAGSDEAAGLLGLAA